MPILSSAVLPRHFAPARGRGTTTIRVSPKLVEAAECVPGTILQSLETTTAGLASSEAEERLARYGLNVVAQERRNGWVTLLGLALVNPLVILLLLLALLSVLTGDLRSASVMFLMVVLGVVLRFVQEARADSAAAKLKAMIRVTATVRRDGRLAEIPLGQLVPGDVIELAAGDMIPADVRILTCKDLFVNQASLTGESFPAEKFDTREEKASVHSALELKNIGWLGTSVESGTATAVVVVTGLETYLGGVSRALVDQPERTGFDKGISQFTWLMIRLLLAMVPVVFLINGLTKHDWREAFFFAMAVAVGLTPEMLPMIVTVCLSKGAIAMSRAKVIVKRLNSIQDLGAMDVLCTDKTGTLTQDRVLLEKHCDVVLHEDDSVLDLTYLNSYFQTGLRNLLDRAILEHRELHDQLPIPEYAKVDEIPFDFSRKIMSVVVRTPEGTHRMITKGAPEEIYRRCTRFELDGHVYPISQILIDDLRTEYDDLSTDGFRVLAMAYRDLDQRTTYSKLDECELILKGYVAFLDPPKETACQAIKALHELGVDVKVLTGDNELVSKKICSEVGIATDNLLLGTQVETMTDADLTEAADRATLCARLSPSHKQRIIRLLKQKGHVVGFLGDGINDAPALRTADVGVSVDTAVDIAKESADVILLEKNLLVLEAGVIEGRKVFANVLKYIRMGASSNFGNMFSVLGASLFLPFVPMAPIQILTNNLLYDFSQVPIPTDEVDPEQITRPRPWSMKDIFRFIVLVGPCSSIFDYTTYFMMYFLFKCQDVAHASLFQTGWFVESLLTQTLIIHIIRTGRIPFLQSRASWPLTLTTITIIVIGIWLPYSPFADALGFTPLPLLYWPLLMLTLLCYMALTQTVKTWLIRRGWVSRM